MAYELYFNKTVATTKEWLKFLKINTTRCQQNIEQLENFYNASENTKWYSHFGTSYLINILLP